MSYQTLLQRLFQLNCNYGMKLGLQNSLQLQEKLGFPDRNYHTIHVGGTNGKGSVTTKMAKAFEYAGYRVGLYTSPHIASFRERIRVNGCMILEQDVTLLLQQLFELIEHEQIPATFFEITTWLALLYFAQQQVDIAVIEVGLGGRLDATNVIAPCLSIITSISLDHTELLGCTREAIAYEKGGIIKAQTPIIIGPHVPSHVIQPLAVQHHSPFISVPDLNFRLFEEENRYIAQTALKYLQTRFKLSSAAIDQGLEIRPPCRFEIISGLPVTILDVAHNPNGLQRLFETIAHYYPKKSVRLLFGLSKNKDLHACLQLIAEHSSHFHLVEAPNGRGAAKEILADHLQSLTKASSTIFLHQCISEAIAAAQQDALRCDQILVICGSFFIMAEIRQTLGFIEAIDTIDSNER